MQRAQARGFNIPRASKGMRRPKPGDPPKDYWDSERRRIEWLKGGSESERGSRLAHRSSYDERCKPCDHPDIGMLEYSYLKWIPPERLAVEFELDFRDLMWHLEGTGMCTTRRSKRGRREAVIAIIEAGMTEMQKRPPRPADTIAALTLYAKLQGELVDKVDYSGPRTIVFANIPEPGGRDRIAESQKAITPVATTPLLLPEIPDAILEPIEEEKGEK